jgi:hypothetical protein
MTCLDEAIAGLRVVPLGERDKLKTRQQVGEMPPYVVAEIVLPKVENPSDHPEHVCRAELARAFHQRIEVAEPVRTCRRVDRADIGRKIGIAVEPRLVDGVDRVHPPVERSGADAARWRCHIDGLGCLERGQGR